MGYDSFWNDFDEDLLSDWKEDWREEMDRRAEQERENDPARLRDNRDSWKKAAMEINTLYNDSNKNWVRAENELRDLRDEVREFLNLVTMGQMASLSQEARQRLLNMLQMVTS